MSKKPPPSPGPTTRPTRPPPQRSGEGASSAMQELQRRQIKAPAASAPKPRK